VIDGKAAVTVVPGDGGILPQLLAAAGAPGTGGHGGGAALRPRGNAPSA
jgi:hypothetical protein